MESEIALWLLIISENAFTLLKLHVQSTVVMYENNYCVPRVRICIGSSVGPILCNIFLLGIDQNVLDLTNARLDK